MLVDLIVSVMILGDPLHRCCNTAIHGGTVHRTQMVGGKQRFIFLVAGIIFAGAHQSPITSVALREQNSVDVVQHLILQDLYGLSIAIFC